MNNIKPIFIVIGVIALIVLLYSFTSSSAGAAGHGPTGTFTGSLVSAAPKAGFTNTYYNTNASTTTTSYWLTYTPDGYVSTQKNIPANLPQTIEITVENYKRFINTYPNGSAPGNVLNSYKA